MIEPINIHHVRQDIWRHGVDIIVGVADKRNPNRSHKHSVSEFLHNSILHGFVSPVA